MLLFYVERPKFFPTETSRQQSKQNYSLSGDMKLLKANKNFWFFLFNFAIIHGIYAALGGTINNLVRPFGYTAI